LYTKDVKDREYIEKHLDRIIGKHIAGSRNIDEVTEAFWKAFGIKIKPGKYHTQERKG